MKYFVAQIFKCFDTHWQLLVTYCKRTNTVRQESGLVSVLYYSHERQEWLQWPSHASLETEHVRKQRAALILFIIFPFCKVFPYLLLYTVFKNYIPVLICTYLDCDRYIIPEHKTWLCEWVVEFFYIILRGQHVRVSCLFCIYIHK